MLWDVLPTGSHLGGAPANFAYIASLLGAEGVLASRVGRDELGRAASARLQRAGVDISHLQVDDNHPTGSTLVSVADDGAAAYEIVRDAAWDYLQWTPALAELAARTDAVCFGTLAQRSPATRAAIRQFLQHTSARCIRLLDANLRPPFWSAETVEQSLRLANVVKLNHLESAEIARVASIEAASDIEMAQALRRRYWLAAVCVTCGANGSILATEHNTSEHPGIPADVVDTIGAGDAFAAALAIQLLSASGPEAANRAANSVAAWVASRRGAMPAPDEVIATLRKTCGFALP